MLKKWWALALVLTVLAGVTIIGMGIVHTTVLIEDITPERDEKISEIYGQILGLVVAGIWAGSFYLGVVKKR